MDFQLPSSHFALMSNKQQLWFQNYHQALKNGVDPKSVAKFENPSAIVVKAYRKKQVAKGHQKKKKKSKHQGKVTSAESEEYSTASRQDLCLFRPCLLGKLVFLRKARTF